MTDLLGSFQVTSGEMEDHYKSTAHFPLFSHKDHMKETESDKILSIQWNSLNENRYYGIC